MEDGLTSEGMHLDKKIKEPRKRPFVASLYCHLMLLSLYAVTCINLSFFNVATFSCILRLNRYMYVDRLVGEINRKGRRRLMFLAIYLVHFCSPNSLEGVIIVSDSFLG